jgi:PPOX class probable F420-dependent enzyme
MDLPDELLALLEKPSTCYIATTMPDGSPQLTQVWADTDGTHILVNTVQGNQKARNIDRDPRVAVTVSSPDDPSRYHAVRGIVTDVTTEGGVEHIEKLSQRYLGGPYPWYGGRDQVRLVVTIAPSKVHSMG